MRQTSIDAYYQIKEEGLLSERRFQTYEMVHRYGPITAAQLIEIARTRFKVSNSGNFATRLSELRNLGVLKEEKIDNCPLTGRRVIFWATTNELPAKPKIKKSNAQIIRELKGALRYVWEHDDCTGNMKNGIMRFFK